MKSVEEIESNFKALKKQVTDLFGFEVVNNYDWCKDINFIDFLRDYGKYFNVNYMLDTDIIRRRLDSGITFTEFSYMIMQALDFLHLYENKNCVMQCAGSDQWGNITAGIDLIRKKTGKEVYGFTMPLVTDKNGKKFGKSEGNAFWLDKNKTSSYEIYQYLVNSDDEKVIDYLKIFTFLTREEIEDIERKHKEKPEERFAQKTLAMEVITFLHGKEEANKAKKMSEALFTGRVNDLSENEINNIFRDVPRFECFDGENIIDLLVNSEICQSKREAREFVNAGSIMINEEKITSEDYIVKCDKAIDGDIIVLRRGKKKYFVGKIV